MPSEADIRREKADARARLEQENQAKREIKSEQRRSGQPSRAAASGTSLGRCWNLY